MGGERMKQHRVYYGLADNKIYEGEVEGGVKQGFGIEYYPNQGDPENPHKFYEGEFYKDKYHGYGTLYFVDGSIKYEGSWRNGRYENFCNTFFHIHEDDHS